jgi:hypothetical protein
MEYESKGVVLHLIKQIIFFYERSLLQGTLVLVSIRFRETRAGHQRRVIPLSGQQLGYVARPGRRRGAPVSIGGRVLVDGGVVNLVPYDHLLKRADFTIIATISDSTCFWGKERCPEEEFGEQTKLRKTEINSSDFKFILMCSVFFFSNGDFFVCGFFRSAVDDGLYRLEGPSLSRPEAARPESGLRTGIAPSAS